MPKPLFHTVILFSVVAIAFSAFTFVLYPVKHAALIREYAHATDMDPAVVAAVIQTESHFRANAISPRGAVGLMQIMPSTADFVAEMSDINEFSLTNPRDNIRLGTAYLQYLFRQFGDLRTVLMAYNAGEGNVRRWLLADPHIAKIPFPETRTYVERVLNAKNFYKFKF